MNIKDIIILIISIFNYIFATVFIYDGVKKYSKGLKEFHFKMLLRHEEYKHKSGILLIVEGVSILLITITWDYFWFR